MQSEKGKNTGKKKKEYWQEKDEGFVCTYMCDLYFFIFKKKHSLAKARFRSIDKCEQIEISFE